MSDWLSDSGELNKDEDVVAILAALNETAVATR
jgi:hypothetical protein